MANNATVTTNDTDVPDDVWSDRGEATLAEPLIDRILRALQAMEDRQAAHFAELTTEIQLQRVASLHNNIQSMEPAQFNTHYGDDTSAVPVVFKSPTTRLVNAVTSAAEESPTTQLVDVVMSAAEERILHLNPGQSHSTLKVSSSTATSPSSGAKKPGDWKHSGTQYIMDHIDATDGNIMAALKAESRRRAQHMPALKDGIGKWFQGVSRIIVSSWAFESFIGLIICLNAVTIGVDASLRHSLRHSPTYSGDDSGESDALNILEIFEHCFLVIYFLELVCRISADGVSVIVKCGWVKFDLLLVSVSVLQLWILQPIMGAERNPFSRVILWRVLRLLRLIKSLRTLHVFKTLRVLLQGLLHSADNMLSTMILLFVALYVFACAGVELINTDEDLLADPAVAPIIHMYFDGIFGTMLTLTQFATMDSIAAVYAPLIRAKPMLACYFIPILLLVSIAIMNLVTAQLVEGAMSRGAENRAEEMKLKMRKAKGMVPDIEKAFSLLDTNGNGSVSRAEVQEGLSLLPDQLAQNIQIADLVEMFEVMDVDGSGQVNQREWVDGVLHCALSDMPKETQRIMKMLEFQKEKLLELTRGHQAVRTYIVSGRNVQPDFGRQENPTAEVENGNTSSSKTSPDFGRRERPTLEGKPIADAQQKIYNASATVDNPFMATLGATSDKLVDESDTLDEGIFTGPAEVGSKAEAPQSQPGASSTAL